MPDPASAASVSQSAPFSIIADSVVSRLERVESFPALALGAAGMTRLHLALPTAYRARGWRRYPVLVLLGCEYMLGSAIEMSRLMAHTGELCESIVLHVDCATSPEGSHLRIIEALRWCARHYRLSSAGHVVFGAAAAAAHVAYAVRSGVAGLSGAIASEPVPLESGPVDSLEHSARMSMRRLLVFDRGGTGDPESPGVQVERFASLAAPGWPVADLTAGLRRLWEPGPQRADALIWLGKPWLWPLWRALAVPLRVMGARSKDLQADDAHLLRSSILARNFELFVSVPKSYAAESNRKFPIVLVLDANLEFATAAEATASMARVGAIDEALVVGIGVPRVEGAQEFAFRRLEEFSPPAVPDYRYDDELGRVMRGMFLLRGQDARQRLGQAPLLYRFVCAEVLPLLHRHYRIDARRLTLLGHSAGAGFTCFALLQPDAPFTDYVAISPGVGIGGDWLRRQIRKGARPAATARRVMLSIGAEEDKGDEGGAGIAQTGNFAAQLQAIAGDAVRYVSYSGEAHASAYVRAVGDALQVALRTGAPSDDSRIASDA